MLKKLIIFALLAVHVRSDAGVPPPPPAPPAPVTCPAPAPPPNPDDKPSIKLDKFDLFKDTEKLCDEVTSKYFKNPKKITKLLCHRSYDQRNQIQETFPCKCDNRVLKDKINSITFMMSQCKHLMKILLTSPVHIYKEAIEEEKTKNNEDDVITQIICSSTNKEKADLIREYPDLPKVLEDYAKNGGDGYKAILTGACLKERKEIPDPSVTPECIEGAANELRNKNGPEFVEKLKEIIGKFGDPELKKIFLKYAELQQDSDLADKILKSFQGKEMEAYLIFVRSIQNKYMYFARQLNHCLKGSEINSNLDCVDRIIAIRCEIDLGNIAENYKSLFQDKITKDLKSCVNIDGEYYEAICKLLGDYE